MIDFDNGVIKEFRADNKTWQQIGTTVPPTLSQRHLDWSYRPCAEGDGRVYVLNTKHGVLHCLDLASRRWVETRQLESTYMAQYAAITYNGGRLYVSGGLSLDGEEEYNAMCSLKVARGKKSHVRMKKEPEMLYRRISHKMVGVGNRVLVCGGLNDAGRVASSEMFDMVTGTWSRLADMPVASSNFGLIPTASAVYVLGGVTEFTGESPKITDAVRVLDLQTQQWTTVSRLPMPLESIQGASRGGSLWLLAAVAGSRLVEYNPSAVVCDNLKCVLEYDATQQEWITHHSTSDAGCEGLCAYTFKL